MNDLSLYYPIGLFHILNWGSYDHILFIFVLCSSYAWRDWKKILVLITAFTLGHSITLALTVLHYLYLPSAWVEFLIPITIALTAIGNLLRKESSPNRNLGSYLLAMFFGFIHGMGFASALQSMLGKESNLWIPLLAFNLGLETGQMVVVFGVLFLTSMVLTFSRWNFRRLNQVFSLLIFFIALYLAYIRFPTTNI